MRTINKAGLDLIKVREGLKLKPYVDSGGVPTIGWGTIEYEGGVKVTLKDAPITEARAEELLMRKVNEFCKVVESAVKVPLSENQFGALVCLCYNIGANAFSKSTLVKKLNQKDYAGAADQFDVWIKDNGKVIQGLINRRQAEKALFLHSIAPASQQPTVADTNVNIQEIEYTDTECRIVTKNKV